MRTLKIHSLPTQKKVWVDRDELILHACFQIFEDCVEEEQLLQHWSSIHHKEFIDEVVFLYQWWKERKSLPTTDLQMVKDDEMLVRLMKIRKNLWV